MSNDLISRSALIEDINQWARDNFSLSDEFGIALVVMEKALCLVENRPTAYDKDKVIEQLEMLRNVSDTGKAYLQEVIDSPLELHEIVRETVINRAIKIVRNGGKND